LKKNKKNKKALGSKNYFYEILFGKNGLNRG
jgi:hypothetical protein